jgi:hypothetical protein
MNETKMTNDLPHVSVKCDLRKNDKGEWVAELNGLSEPHYFTDKDVVGAMRKAIGYMESIGGQVVVSELIRSPM